MSLNPDIRDQAYQFFIEEAQELLQVLENGLLNLKDDHSTSKVHELMRAAHSIKGGAASVELETIKLIAHRLEDFFKALYSEKVDFDAELEGLLLKAYDGLREPLTEQMEFGSFDEESALLNVEPTFEELEEILGDALKEADNYIPSATDLGVDIVASIFEIDVQQSLDRLANAIDNYEQFDVSQELKDQLEVLGGFAELFTLPGFSEIIDFGSQAIANKPDRGLEIAKIIVNDCSQARTAILEGDRTRGGEPSPQLRAIAKKGIPPNTNDSSLLNALNSAAVNESDEELKPAKSLEDLFGGSVTKENRDISDLSFHDYDRPHQASPDLDDLFGDSLTDANRENTEVFDDSISVFETIDSTDEENIFDFVSETDEGMIFDWEEIPPQDLTKKSESNSSFLEDIADYDEIEDETENIFENIPEETNPFEIVESDIIEIGSKILDGEIVEAFPESSFPKNQDSADKFINESELELQSNQEKLAENNLEIIEETKVEQAAEFFAPPENLDTALKSIEDIFEQLPPAQTTDIIPQKSDTTKKQSPKKAKNKAAKQVSLANQLSVRVDLERLERMNNIIGELVINRNSLALQNQQLQLNVKDLNHKFVRFRGITNKLRELSDGMLVGSEHSLSKIASSKIAEFDSLEMDSYSSLHLLLQSILEEIVQLEEGVDDISLFAEQSDRTVNSQRQMLGQMRDELMWARMLPLEQILKRFPRTLRDLSSKYQKPVDLNLIGTGVLVDKAVLEKLFDPLQHLLRNGFDHGIEPPEIRHQKGKPEVGKIEIHAYYQGNQTIIEIRDDGKGLDTQKIIKKAISKGLISEQEAANATQERIFDLIFEPGFSTAEQVSEISGRGVGMSVVKEQIESLNGHISVASTPNKGSVFTLALPLTLTIAKLLVIALEEIAFALPSDSIEEIVIPLPNQIKSTNNQRFLYWKDRLISIYNLQDILQYNCQIIPIDRNSKIFETVNAPSDWALPLLLLRRGNNLFALEVTRLITEQELVIKPFSEIYTAPLYTYGCTILGDGTLIPVLNGALLISDFLGEIVTYSKSTKPEIKTDLETASSTNLEATELTAKTQQNITTANTNIHKNTSKIKQQTIMIIDDSTALRRTMALSLEHQGYRVLQAKDGRDAIEQLRKTSHVDLIVCDVEMPHMNGFEFLGVRRRDSELKIIPVIMLTSRSGAKHRNLANQLGANGYFTKPYVEESFLKELGKILDIKQSNNSQKIGRSSNLNYKETILIIDDSSALRKTMSLSLTRKGYRVLEARDGEEGIEQMYQNNDISLVICDIEMPKMNGFEVLSSRRQDSQLQKIPVAMLTSRSQEKHQNLAKQLGANGYFIKPYVEDSFLIEIKKIIKR